MCQNKIFAVVFNKFVFIVIIVLFFKSVSLAYLPELDGVQIDKGTYFHTVIHGFDNFIDANEYENTYGCFEGEPCYDFPSHNFISNSSTITKEEVTYDSSYIKSCYTYNKKIIDVKNLSYQDCSICPFTQSYEDTTRKCYTYDLKTSVYYGVNLSSGSFKESDDQKYSDLDIDEKLIYTKCSIASLGDSYTVTENTGSVQLKYIRDGSTLVLVGKLDIITNNSSKPSIHDFTVNGFKPEVISYTYDKYSSSSHIYMLSANVEWKIPCSAKVGGTILLQPAIADGYGKFVIRSIKLEKPICSLNISSLTSSNTILNAASGGSIGFTGSINESASWTLSVLNRTFTGSGSTANVVWDGKLNDGTVVTPGSYSATLTAQTADGQCTDSKTINFTVTPTFDGQCGLYVQFGSSAHVASGNLSHSQDLFSSNGGSLPLGLSLYYNSLDPANGSLGRGWSHDYDISLKENSDGSVLISKGNWRHESYTLSSGVYVAQAGNYSALVKNTDGTFTLISKDGQATTFSSAGKLTSISDRNGNNQSFAYSGNNLSSVTDPSGRTAVFSYDGSNHLTSVTDPSGNTYQFSVGDTLSGVTQPDGGAWRYTYDSNAFMLSKTDPLGNTTSYSYDDKHRVTGSSDPEGRTRSIYYPQTTDTVKTTTFTEKDGGNWSYSYDTQKGVLLSKTDPQGGTTSYGYDANGNRTSTTNPDGTTTSSVYDNQGNMTSVTNALGQTTSYTYNSLGQVTGITDSQGTTAYAYDAKGNMTSLTDPAGATTTYGYDTKGNIAKVTTPLGQTTRFTYDARGNLATISDPSGATTGYRYDANGNVIAITDPKGAVTKYVYDNRNRVIKSIDHTGNTSTSSYDLGGNKLSDTDANGNTTKYEYNSRNQLVKTIDSLGNATLFSYGGTGCSSCGGGGNDKLTSLTDANNNLTGYEYDQLGRLARETDPLGNVTSYTYDSKGNLTGKTDNIGNTISYSYDANNRLLKKSYPDSTEDTFTYDAKGNILTATNKNIGYAFTYDAAGRMLSSTDSSNKTLGYEYDLAGNRTALTTPEGKRITYGYDTNNRLSSIVSPDGTFGIAYDSLGRRTKLSYPNGATASYHYDSSGRLVKLEHKTRHGRTIDSFAYTLDNVGNRLTTTERGTVTSYGYDAIYRLLYAQQGRRHDSRDNEQYSYDPVGNRLTGPRQQTGYSYGTGNQLLTRDQASFTYDKNGNLIERSLDNDRSGCHGHHSKSWKYTFDYENRLVKAENGAVSLSFAYDPFGRRIEKKVEITGPGERGHDVEEGLTHYLYDGMNLIRETREGRRHAARSETTSYLHGPNIDEPLAAESDHRSWYYHADGLGSIVALSDRHGTLVQEYDYDSFGNPDQRGENIDQPFVYTGREWDRETGLYYYRARYYDPKIGRFISKDPISFAGGDVNLYGYVQNNPINFTDPLGLSPLGAVKKALRKVYDKLGGKLPKGKPGKFGSPQCGTPKKGYRLDPAHPEAAPGSPESGPHINWWDYTDGKRGSGGISGAEPIIGGLLGIVGSMLDPFDAISGELAGPEDDML